MGYAFVAVLHNLYLAVPLLLLVLLTTAVAHLVSPAARVAALTGVVLSSLAALAFEYVGVILVAAASAGPDLVLAVLTLVAAAVLLAPVVVLRRPGRPAR